MNPVANDLSIYSLQMPDRAILPREKVELYRKLCYPETQIKTMAFPLQVRQTGIIVLNV